MRSPDSGLVRHLKECCQQNEVRQSRWERVVSMKEDRFSYWCTLITYSRNMWWLPLAVMIGLIARGALGAYPIRLIKAVVDEAVAGNLAAAGRAAVILFAVRVSAAAAYLVSATTGDYFKRLLALNIRQDFFSKLLSQRATFFEKHPTGELLSRINDDVETMADSFTSPLFWLGGSIISFAFTLYFLISLDFELSLIYLPVAVFMGVTGKLVSVFSRKVWASFRSTNGLLFSFIEECLQGIKDIQAFCNQQMMNDKFVNISKTITRNGMKSTFWSELLGMSNQAIYALGAAMILFVGGKKVVQGEMTAGDLSAFITYAGVLTGPINQFAHNYERLSRGVVSASRVLCLFQDSTYTTQNAKLMEAPDFKGKIEFDEVGFSYGRETVLDGVSFAVMPGEKVAVVGKNGAGKSTLVELLLGFQTPSRGSIKIDGVDITKLPIDVVRRTISVVFQKPSLFAGTLYENILFGNLNACPDRVHRAAACAGAAEFAKDLPDGYDTRLNKGSTGLSGGQQQRIALARALVKDACVYMLDEVTSSLDVPTKRRVLSCLLDYLNGKTVLIITHDMDICDKVDKVLLLDNGRVRHYGSHYELLCTCELYREMYHGTKDRH